LSYLVQQQRHPQKSNIGMPNFHSHFRLKPSLNRMFAWSNKLRKIHLLILIACIYLFFQLPLMNNYSNEFIESLSSESSGLSMIYNLFEQASARQCSSSSLISLYNIRSYTSMTLLIILLYVGSLLLSALAQSFYSYACPVQLVKPYRWICWCRKIFICLVGASICNQLVNALACRPIEILYEIRYSSMLIVQIFGYVICLLFAFFSWY